MRVQRCRGTRDLSPEEMRRFRLIEGEFRQACLQSGYQEIRTPTLEYLHLFTSTGTLTPGRLGRVYSFLDWDGWSGERVVLRPDATIPVARAYIERQEQGLARLFYVVNTFTFEPSGQEDRETWQCGAELIGAASVLADVELITLAGEVLARLGIRDTELKLSHAGIIKALLVRFGLSPQEQAAVFDRLLDGDAAALTSLTTRVPELGETLTPLLDLQGRSAGFLRNLKSLLSRDLPELETALDNLAGIVEALDALGCRYVIDIASGRGFEYYTGIMYQFLAGGQPVARGGRYDALIPLMGGPEVPASGFGLGIDRLLGLVNTDILNGRQAPRVLVRAGSTAPEAVREAFRLAEALRRAGYAAEMDLGHGAGDIAWKVDTTRAPASYVLTEVTTGRQTEASTTEEVLAVLGGRA